MILILGDLLADYSLRVPTITSRPKDLHPVSYLELGPGGAANVAITAARFGLAVGCLGEVGDDLFGRVVLDGLAAEGIDIAAMIVSAGKRTPVANVLVDEGGEPAYLGFPGTLALDRVPKAWRPLIAEAEALFCDGWADHPGAAAVVLEAFRLARDSGVPVFFDPGPGNPGLDNEWHRRAASLSTVLLATDEEASRLTGVADPLDAARAALDLGPKLVISKRAVAGCFLITREELVIAPGFPVLLVDATGAGDSFAGAVMSGYLGGSSLPELGLLANATGAAKVQKAGTGRNMPTLDEVRAVLRRFGYYAQAGSL